MKGAKSSVFLLLFLIPGLVAADRPSITSLQQQINELNARLNTVEADLRTKRTLYLKSNGQNVGVLIEIADTLLGVRTSGIYHGLLLEEYLFGVDIQTGELEPFVREFFYLDTVCSGEPYVRVSTPVNYRPGDPLPVETQGRVFPTPLSNDTTPAYQIARDTSAVALTAVAFKSTAGGIGVDRCEEIISPREDVYFPVLPNSKDTGVPQPPLATPITIGY